MLSLLLIMPSISLKMYLGDHDPPMTGCRSPIKKVVRGAYDSTLLLRWIDAI